MNQYYYHTILDDAEMEYENQFAKEECGHALYQDEAFCSNIKSIEMSTYDISDEKVLAIAEKMMGGKFGF